MRSENRIKIEVKIGGQTLTLDYDAAYNQKSFVDQLRAVHEKAEKFIKANVKE